MKSVGPQKMFATCCFLVIRNALGCPKAVLGLPTQYLADMRIVMFHLSRF